jgi:L-lactate utilization protein LutC
MAGSVEARGEVLRRIRTATLATADPAAIDAEWKGIRRAYKDAASDDREGLLHQLPDGVSFVEDSRADLTSVDACEGVLTSATLAIAETGTIVLQDAPGQGRRAVTLLPDYHLCVVDAAKVVQTVPEAIALLQATAAKATTFFSGPSATADIEMTRIKGVHGPRFVDVVLVLA